MKTGIVAKLPDGPRFKDRFDFVSSRSGRVYRISRDTARKDGSWTCSCGSSVYRGYCRHLAELGLKGRMGVGGRVEHPNLFWVSASTRS